MEDQIKQLELMLQFMQQQRDAANNSVVHLAAQVEMLQAKLKAKDEVVAEQPAASE
jgi:hypothetical protein